jgi:flagellar hook-associated protein 3 FlgL
MSITTGVSFLAQTRSQTSRLLGMGSTMADLQRQLTSSKKSVTYSGLGFAAQGIQQHRMDVSRMDIYMTNIDHATTSVKMMSTSVQSIHKIGTDLLSALQAQFRADPIDMNTIRQTAQNGLEFVEDLINLDLNGKYLFGGSASTTKPLANAGLGVTAIQNNLTDWFDGTLTSAQLMTNVEGLTATQLGFDPLMTSATNTSTRIDEYTDLDITSIAGQNGFEQMMMMLTMAANIDIPDPMVDVATSADFNDVLNRMIAVTRQAVTSVEALANTLGGKYEFLGSVRLSHEDEKSMLQGLIDGAENVDPTEVSAKILTLQTQMESAYQVTNLVSQLSLINYI